MPKSMIPSKLLKALTKEQCENLLSNIRRGKDDEEFFFSYFLGLPMHEGQKRWSKGSTKPINILPPGNKWGKFGRDDEPVLTPSGWVLLGKISVGDKVFSQDGSITTVTGVFPQGKRDCWDFVFDDGARVASGDEHLWYCQTPRNRFVKNYNENGKEYPNREYGKWSVLTTQEIIDRWGMEPKAKNRIAIPVVDPIKFPIKDVPLDPYILGLMLGDGACTKGMFTGIDQELISAIGKKFKLRRVLNNDYRVYGILPFLRKAGIYGKRSWEKFIPDEYLWNDIKTRLAVLQGLMDTDGNIETHCGKTEFMSVSKRLAEDVIFIVRSLGGKGVISTKKTSFKYKGEKKAGRLAYRVRFKIPGVVPFRLKRKVDRYYKDSRTRNRILKKIEYVGKHKSTCIRVAHPSKLYVAKDFIVTHNTAFVAGRHIHKNFYKLGAIGDPAEIAKVEYQTLVISPVGGQSKRTQQYIKQILSSSFSWVDPVSAQRVTNPCKIGWFFADSIESDLACVKYSNGARTDIRSIGDDKGSKLQGTDWYYISYDEWTRSYHLDEEIDANILPRVILYKGNLDLIGTPDMESQSLQYVHDLIETAIHNPDDYYYQAGSMNENIFFPEENKRRMLAVIKDPEKIKQIMEGTIVISGGKMFGSDIVSRIWIPGVEWTSEADLRDIINREYLSDVPSDKLVLDLDGQVYKLPEVIDGYKIGDFVIAMDWHLSEGGDETVIYVIRYDVVPHEIVYYLATKRGNPYVKHDKVRNLHKIYNNASLVLDSQGVGKQLGYDLDDLQPSCFDSVSTGKDKKTMLTILKNFLSYRDREILTGKFRAPYIKNLSQQLSMYREDDRKLRQDHVMTLGVAAWWIENNGGPVVQINDKRY